MLYAGTDVHFLVMVCTKEGEIVKKGRIRTNKKKFFGGLKKVKVSIEASTNYIVDALSKNGYEVVVAHSLKTRAIARQKLKVIK